LTWSGPCWTYGKDPGSPKLRLFNTALSFVTAIGLGRQWPMLLAGGLSIIAGATYLPAALGEEPNLTALIMYTAAGGSFFVIQAAILAWKQRRRLKAS
jgi:hypothetical protein